MLTKSLIAIAALTLAASLAQAGGNDAQIDKSKQLLRPHGRLRRQGSAE